MMKRAQFRPCIDLHDGVVKQIVGGTLSDHGGPPRTNFIASQSPDYFARLYRRDQLQGGHVIQLGPGNEQAAQQALAAWPGGLQLGGGIHPGNAEYWLDAGASHLIVTSCVFADGELRRDKLAELVRLVGRERLVLDLSCRFREGQYYIVTNRWQKFTRHTVEGSLLRELADSAAEFLIHAVDVEGRQTGIDHRLLELLAAESPIDCVYAGGIASFEDIAVIEKAGRGRIHYTIGSALDLFGGPLSYQEVVAHAALPPDSSGCD